MIRKSAGMRVVSCVCVMLALSTCTWDLCFAQGADSTQTGDSTAVEPQTPDIYEGVIPVSIIPPGMASEDSLAAGVAPEDTLIAGAEDTRSPAYRKWWVWALVTVGVVVVPMVAASSSEDETEPDLPDFPDPPDR